jgi:hypothetical protein
MCSGLSRVKPFDHIGGVMVSVKWFDTTEARTHNLPNANHYTTNVVKWFDTTEARTHNLPNANHYTTNVVKWFDTTFAASLFNMQH